MEMREQHNRQVQLDIDFERKEIDKLKSEKEKLVPKIMEHELALEAINIDVRKMDIDMDCRETKIKVLSDRFWK